jgi:hypothetical protein
MMVKLLGETSSIQGKKEKLLGTFHKTRLLLECTFNLLGHPQEYNCTFCETYFFFLSLDHHYDITVNPWRWHDLL